MRPPAQTPVAAHACLAGNGGRTVARRGPNRSKVIAWLDGCPGELRDMVLALRDLVRDVAPEAVEDVKFNTLCYYKPGHPYGSIGGNVCMISWKDGRAFLSFIHGAQLPDPQRLLKGRAKAKRFVELRGLMDVPRAALEELVQAAVEYSPISEDGGP
jgi:hypothetical protein